MLVSGMESQRVRESQWDVIAAQLEKKRDPQSRASQSSHEENYPFNISLDLQGFIPRIV